MEENVELLEGGFYKHPDKGEVIVVEIHGERVCCTDTDYKNKHWFGMNDEFHQNLTYSLPDETLFLEDDVI